jgi:hypothetical protein
MPTAVVYRLGQQSPPCSGWTRTQLRQSFQFITKSESISPFDGEDACLHREKALTPLDLLGNLWEILAAAADNMSPPHRALNVEEKS